MAEKFEWTDYTTLDGPLVDEDPELVDHLKDSFGQDYFADDYLLSAFGKSLENPVYFQVGYLNLKDFGIQVHSKDAFFSSSISPELKFKVEGHDRDAAKKIVEATVERLTDGQNLSIDQIGNHLKTQIDQYHKYPIENARKTGYVQGVCECVAVIGNDHALGKKLLSEMKVTREMAQKYAKPETFKELEKGIFASQPEQKLEQAHSRGI